MPRPVKGGAKSALAIGGMCQALVTDRGYRACGGEGKSLYPQRDRVLLSWMVRIPQMIVFRFRTIVKPARLPLRRISPMRRAAASAADRRRFSQARGLSPFGS